MESHDGVDFNFIIPSENRRGKLQYCAPISTFMFLSLLLTHDGNQGVASEVKCK